jgi:hypothetical protein
VHQGDDISIRRKKRYNHVLINLMVQTGDQWKRIRAADWNEVGFNFIFDQDLTERSLTFKKGTVQFTGQIVWSHRKSDETFLMETVLNTMILNHLKKLASDRETAQKMLELIRISGRIEEKERVLKKIDDFPGDYKAVRELIQKEKPDYPYFRYGVKIASPDWEEIIHQTLKASEVVLQLSKLGEGLSNLSE